MGALINPPNLEGVLLFKELVRFYISMQGQNSRAQIQISPEVSELSREINSFFTGISHKAKHPHLLILCMFNSRIVHVNCSSLIELKSEN